MTNREEVLEMLTDSDEEFKNLLAGMTADQAFQYVSRMHQLMSSDPASFPEISPEFVEQMDHIAKQYLTADRDKKAADLNLALAEAKFNQIARECLDLTPDDEKGH